MSHNSTPVTESELPNEEPSCKPLDTYEEILAFLEDPPSWRSLCKEMTPHSSDKIRNISMSSLVGEIAPDRPPTFCHFSPDQEDAEREPASSLPKTLVCHDMANGYHDDSKIDGTSNHTAYTFYHWGGIDIFCYFSHHLITIPPVGWINTGHAHGVKVIGTVITEWTEGVDFWDYVLEDEARYQELATALVTIAQTLKFDGWLLNIENKISKPLVLLEFVRYFHRKLHEEIEDSELIWYDSVTIKGNLNWQNGLNDSNKDFFEACDGFFTNYSWKEEDVASSAEAAGRRVTDLYIGIDVWGRNFYGGGQFNTAAAVELASSYGCSLAIFAPAWTYEAASVRGADIALAETLPMSLLLQLRERALWGSLWPYLCTGLPSRLPFQTSFCRGGGSKRRLYGEVMSPGPWYNLRHMQYQPNSCYGPHGYLLSTPELIAQVSHQGVIRDKTKGIIKYHSAFEASRRELHRVRSARELHEHERDHHDSLTLVQTPPDSQDDRQTDRRANEQDDGQVDRVVDRQDNRQADGQADDSDDRNKHSMKNTFKHMFRLKSRRRSNESPSQPHDLTAGWSMRQLSVSLRLGPRPAPPRLALACLPGELPCLEPCLLDSYTGGSCLRVHPSDPVSPEHRWTRLFHCDFPCENELVLCVVTKTLPGHASQSLDVKLFARDLSGEELRVSCVGVTQPDPGIVKDSSPQVYPLAPGRALSDLQKYLLLQQPGFYQSVENSFGWNVRYYVVPLGAVRVTSINVRCGQNEGPILLGHIGLCHRFEEDEEAYNFIQDEKPRLVRETQQSGQCLPCAAKLLGANNVAPSTGGSASQPRRERDAAGTQARDAAGTQARDDGSQARDEVGTQARDKVNTPTLDTAGIPTRDRAGSPTLDTAGISTRDIAGNLARDSSMTRDKDKTLAREAAATPAQDAADTISQHEAGTTAWDAADNPSRDAAYRSSSLVDDIGYRETRTVETDLPRIHRESKKIEFEKLPGESMADHDAASFHVEKNHLDLSSAGSFVSAGTPTTLTSKSSLNRPASTKESRASELSDKPT